MAAMGENQGTEEARARRLDLLRCRSASIASHEGFTFSSIARRQSQRGQRHLHTDENAAAYAGEPTSSWWMLGTTYVATFQTHSYTTKDASVKGGIHPGYLLRTQRQVDVVSDHSFGRNRTQTDRSCFVGLGVWFNNKQQISTIL